MIRLAAKTLFSAPRRWVTAVIGVGLAGTVMMFQAGIYFGFRSSASALVNRIGGDVWLMHKGVRHVDQGRRLPLRALDLVRSDACVRAVEPVIVSYATYERSDGLVDSVQLVGFEPSRRDLPWNTTAGQPADLGAPMRVSLDTFDASVVPHPRPPLGSSLRIQGHDATVAVVTEGIRSPGLTPIIFLAVDSARRALGWSSRDATYLVARLEEGCAAAFIARANQDAELIALSREDFATGTEDEVVESSGIGGALAFVALLGLVVATGVVSQTLSSMLNELRPVIAMLKATGFSAGQVARFVLWQAAFIGAVGGALSLALSASLSPLLDGLAVPLAFPALTWPLSLLLLFTVALGSGIIAARSAYAASPLEVLA